MKSIYHIKDLTEPFIRWAAAQPDIQAAALVGSYAHSTANETSDIDMMLLVDDPTRYTANTDWLKQFGVIEKQVIEDYGMVTSLRVWYRSSYEVEFGITTPNWGQSLEDEETQHVINDGMIVLFDRLNLLKFTG